MSGIGQRYGSGAREAKACGALALAAACLSPGSARASGFLLYDQSGDSMGKASAVVASVAEPAAIWYNAAGLCSVPGYQASVSAMLYHVRIRFDDAATGAETRADPGLFVIPTLFASAQVADRVHVGLGAYSSFGLGSTWPYSWEGRDQTIESSLQTVTINPTVAVKLTESVRLGAGFDLLRASVDMRNGLPYPIDGDVRVGGGTWGYGGNVGLQARLLRDKLHMGVAYRSRVELSFRGKADFSPAHPEFLRDLPDQGGTANVTLPDILTAGILFKPWPETALTAEASMVFWSTWDKLELDFDSAPPAISNYHLRNVFIARVGADLPTPVRGVRARTGMMFEQKPTREEYLSPSLPDSYVFDMAVGAGYEHEWLKLDAGYVIGMNWPSKAKGGVESPEGTYWTVSHVVGLTVTGRTAR